MFHKIKITNLQVIGYYLHKIMITSTQLSSLLCVVKKEHISWERSSKSSTSNFQMQTLIYFIDEPARPPKLLKETVFKTN